jgi:hypothetical protein
MTWRQAALGVTVVPLLDGSIEKQIAKAGTPKRQQACRRKVVVTFSKMTATGLLSFQPAGLTCPQAAVCVTVMYPSGYI